MCVWLSLPTHTHTLGTLCSVEDVVVAVAEVRVHAV